MKRLLLVLLLFAVRAHATSIAQWPLVSNGNDTSGNALTLTAVGSVPFNGPGCAPGDATASGIYSASNYWTFPTTVNATLATDSLAGWWTIELFIYLSTTAGSSGNMGIIDARGSTQIQFMRFNAGNTQFDWNNGVNVIDGGAVSTGVCNDIVFVANTTGSPTRKIYQNGVLVASDNGAITWPTAGLTTGVGNDPGATSFFLTGFLDGISVNGAAGGSAPTFTSTDTVTPLQTRTSTATISPTWSMTSTSTKTPTFTQTSTITPTITPTFTQTRTITVTGTITPSITWTSTFTSTITPTFSFSSTGTRTITPSATPTITITFTPVVVAFVTSVSYSFANSPVISIPYTASPSGVDELLCVVIGTNNTDNSSTVTSVTFGGVTMVPQVQLPSLQYSEGIELWTLSLGAAPYSITGTVVITQPSYNSIINDNIAIMEYRGAGQNALFNLTTATSLQQAKQATIITAVLNLQGHQSTVLSAYSGVKGITEFPSSLGGFVNRQYFHKYNMFASEDDQGPISAPVPKIAVYGSLPPNNPGASVLEAEIPSFSFWTPSPTPTITQTPTISPTFSVSPTPTITLTPTPVM